MKIIVISDTDGHTYGIPHTEQNVNRIKEQALEAGFDGDYIFNSRNGPCHIIDTDNLSQYPQFNPFL